MPEPTQIGNYVIQRLIREGRSANSYCAENALIRSQRVLLRVLRPEAAKNPEFVQEFMSEVRLAARLNHTCIASVLDLKDDGERVYAVLEYIEGVDLTEMVERHGTPPPEVAAAIMRDICTALEQAHARHVMHRHLRPRQIKLTPEGGVKVLGFGLLSQRGLLHSVVIPDAMREELYRPPEQVREEPEDGRSDLYTLAVIIHELLTKRLPFESIVGPARGDPPRKPPSVHADQPLVPASFAHVLERMLSERKSDRPADASAVRRVLDDVLDAFHVMHSSDLLRSYLGNPSDFADKARRRSIEALMREAEGLAKGGDAERRAAIRDLERLLEADPNNRQAQSLIRKLKPSSDPGRAAGAAASPKPLDPNRTIVDIPGDESWRQTVARLGPPSPAIPATATPEADRPPGPGRSPERDPDPSRTPDLESDSDDYDSSSDIPALGTGDVHPARRNRGLLIGSAVAVVVLTIVTAVVILIPSQVPREPPPPDEIPPVPESARLEVETFPSGAQLTVPALGETQLSPAVFNNLSGDSVRILATLAGFRPADTSVSLTASGPNRVALVLVSMGAQACTLFVDVTPKAHRVLVDGRTATSRDSVHWSLAVAPGTHSVEASAAGFATWKRVSAARLIAGASLHLPVTLRAEPLDPELGHGQTVVKPPSPAPPTPSTSPPPPSATGQLPWNVPNGIKVTVKSEPAAQLYVDGVRYPTLVQRADLVMAAGEHLFRLVHPDYVEWKKAKKLKASKNHYDVHWDFRIGHGILSITAPNHGNQVFVRGKFRGYPNLVLNDIEPGRCKVQLRDKTGTTVIDSSEVIVENSSVPLKINF